MGLAIFIVALVICAVGALGLLVAFKNDEGYSFGVGILFLGLLIIALDSFTVVSAKTTAVQISMGKAIGTLDNGFHIVRPWSSTESFSTAKQPLKLSGGGDDNGDPIEVRLANGTTATVEVSAEWRLIDGMDITKIYGDYKTFDKLTEDVVRRRLSAVLNRVFEKYDPLAAISGKGEVTPLNNLEKSAQALLQTEMPPEIKIETLYLPKIKYADSVQSQIDSFINAVNETKIAKQQLETATARKEANDKLAQGNQSPGVLYQNCLDLVERLVKDGKTLPPAFTCSGAGALTTLPVGGAQK